MLWDVPSPTTAPHQPAGVRQEQDGVTSTGLSLPPPSHGGHAGIEEGLGSLRFWEVRIPFQNATPATLQGTALRAFWLKPVEGLQQFARGWLCLIC